MKHEHVGNMNSANVMHGKHDRTAARKTLPCCSSRWHQMISKRQSEMTHRPPVGPLLAINCPASTRDQLYLYITAQKRHLLQRL